MKLKFYNPLVRLPANVLSACSSPTVPSLHRREFVTHLLELECPTFQGCVYKLLSRSSAEFQYHIVASDLINSKVYKRVASEMRSADKKYHGLRVTNNPLPLIDACISEYLDDYYHLSTGIHCKLEMQELRQVRYFDKLRYYDFDKLSRGAFLNIQQSDLVYSSTYVQLRTSEETFNVDGVQCRCFEITYHDWHPNTVGTFKALLIPELFNATGEFIVRDYRNANNLMLDFYGASSGVNTEDNEYYFTLDSLFANVDLFGDFAYAIIAALISCEEICKHAHSKSKGTVLKSSIIKSSKSKASSGKFAKFEPLIRPLKVSKRVKSSKGGTHASPRPHVRASHTRTYADGHTVVIPSTNVGGRPSSSSQDKVAKIKITNN